MTYSTVDPTQAKALIDDGWTYLDVRTVQEFERGHAEGAFNVPFAIPNEEFGSMQPNPDFVDVVKKVFASDAKLVVACAAGGRSMHACEVLTGEGYIQLANMHGGFSGVRDMSGNVVQAGWAELGYSNTTDAEPDRTYEALRGK